MQSLEVSGAVRPIYGSLGVKRLMVRNTLRISGPVMGQIFKFLMTCSSLSCPVSIHFCEHRVPVADHSLRILEHIGNFMTFTGL